MECSTDGHESNTMKSKRHVTESGGFSYPGGIADNSPPFQRWDHHAATDKSPVRDDRNPNPNLNLNLNLSTLWLRLCRAVILVLFTQSSIFAAAPESPHWPAKVFAPYAYIPKNFINITDCLAATGQKYYTLAFIISDREGFPAWDGSSDLRIGTNYYASQIQALRAVGGDVLISFGGEAGAEIAINTTNATDLQAKYQSVIDEYHLTWMDFDIEGKALSKMDANHRRNLVLSQLQKKNSSLLISFTLPVNPTGMEDESLIMLKDAVSKGVKIESVNIMTMDYGARISAGNKMGDLAISASNASHRQTLSIDPAIKIGITPMIGQNDQKGEIFTLDDARAVLAFAKTNGWVRSVSFWSSNRDHPKGARKGSNHSSGIEQQDWDFTSIFKPFSE
jgi:hypothetical protein